MILSLVDTEKRDVLDLYKECVDQHTEIRVTSDMHPMAEMKCQ